MEITRFYLINYIAISYFAWQRIGIREEAIVAKNMFGRQSKLQYQQSKRAKVGKHLISINPYNWCWLIWSSSKFDFYFLCLKNLYLTKIIWQVCTGKTLRASTMLQNTNVKALGCHWIINHQFLLIFFFHQLNWFFS